jgi:hypothetical protein
MRDIRRMAEYGNRLAALKRITSEPASPGAPVSSTR